MPPKAKSQDSTVPVAPVASPADPGNPNVPANAQPSATPSIPGYQPPGSVTDQNGQSVPYGQVLVQAGNISIWVDMGAGVNTDDHVKIGGTSAPHGPGFSRATTDDAATYGTVIDTIQSIQKWYGNATQRQQMINEMYNAGLLSSKKSPSTTDVIRAWSLLVQEASIEKDITPQELLNKAAQGGYNALNPTLKTNDLGASNSTGNTNNVPDASTTTSQTIYKSYLDPATIMGAQADAWYRLVGRNPNPQEYQAFLDQVYSYQNAANTGKFETQTKSPSDKVTYDPTSGQPVGPQGTTDGSTDPTTATSVVSQRGIGTRGLEFLAGQAALANPEGANYQAATTVLNAIIKALGSPGSGLSGSGPTVSAP